PLRPGEAVIGATMQLGIALPGREDAPAIPEVGDDVGFVQRARATDQVADVCRGVLAEAGEEVCRRGFRPAAASGDPARGREMVKGADGLAPMLETGGAHAPVVVERRTRELALVGLDAAPLEREAVRGEPQ